MRSPSELDEGGAGRSPPERVRAPSMRAPAAIIAVGLVGLVVVAIASRAPSPATRSPTPLPAPTVEPVAFAATPDVAHFWLSIDQPHGNPALTVPLHQGPGQMRRTELALPPELRDGSPSVRLMGRTAHGDPPTTLAVMSLGPAGLMPALPFTIEIAQGLTVLVDPLQAPYAPAHWRFSFNAPSQLWSYRAFLAALGPGHQALTVAVNPVEP